MPVMSSDFSSTRFTQDLESGSIGMVAPFLSLAHSLGVGPSIPTFATKFEVFAFTVCGVIGVAASGWELASVTAFTLGIPLVTGLLRLLLGSSQQTSCLWPHFLQKLHCLQASTV